MPPPGASPSAVRPALQHPAELLAAGRPADAAEALAAVVAEAPTYAAAHVLLAVALDAAGRPREALAAWNRAAFLVPRSPLVRRERRRLLDAVRAAPAPPAEATPVAPPPAETTPAKAPAAAPPPAEDPSAVTGRDDAPTEAPAATDAAPATGSAEAPAETAASEPQAVSPEPQAEPLSTPEGPAAEAPDAFAEALDGLTEEPAPAAHAADAWALDADSPETDLPPLETVPLDDFVFADAFPSDGPTSDGFDPESFDFSAFDIDADDADWLGGATPAPAAPAAPEPAALAPDAPAEPLADWGEDDPASARLVLPDDDAPAAAGTADDAPAADLAVFEDLPASAPEPPVGVPVSGLPPATPPTFEFTDLTPPPADLSPADAAFADPTAEPPRSADDLTADEPATALPAEPVGEPPLSVADELDSLIASLETAPRIRPDPAFDGPAVRVTSADVDEMATETLARIYAAQHQYVQAALVYESLAAREPERAAAFLDQAAEMRRRRA